MDNEQVRDWINLGLVGNSIAMDWYAMTHDQPLPSQSTMRRTLGADLSGVSSNPYGFPVGVNVGPSTGTSLLLIGAVMIGLFVLLK